MSEKKMAYGSPNVHKLFHDSATKSIAKTDKYRPVSITDFRPGMT
jgi:hypothetical protein